MKDRFSLKHREHDGSMVFGAPHELHNEVLITVPPGYFGTELPRWIDVPDFTVISEGMAIQEQASIPKRRSPSISARAIGENIWHNLTNGLNLKPNYRFVAMSAPSTDDRRIAVSGPYTEVMELLMEAWSIEQGGYGRFNVEVLATSPSTGYNGDDTCVHVTLEVAR